MAKKPTAKEVSDAIKAASGSSESIYEKPSKPKKGEESYEYGDNKTRNTKYYSSTQDSKIGKKAETLKALGKAKEKDLTDKEAKGVYEDPKAKGKNFSKVTITNVDSEAYDRVMKRAQDSGLSAKDAKKAIDGAIRTVSGNLQTDRSKVAMRNKMQASKNKKKAQDKIRNGY